MMTWHNMKNRLSCRLARLAFAVTLLLATGLTAEAQQYVFMYKNGNTYNFLYNNSNTLGNTTTFNASTCVFSYTNNQFQNGARYLNRSKSTLSLSMTASNWVIASYGRVYYDASTDRYIQFNSGWETLAQSNSPGTGTAYTVLFAYSSHEKSLDDPTITGDAVLSATGDYNYSVAATFHPAYSQFDGYSGTNTVSYYHDGSSMTTTKPSNTNVTTGTWTLEGGSTYASVNSTNGKITIISLPTNDLTMTLKCQVTSNSLTKSAEKTILLYGTTIATPTITRTGNSVALSTTSLNATIYYTTDGTTPTASSTPYTSPIDLTSLTLPVTIKAIAIRNGNSSSVVTSGEYQSLICAQPVIGFAPDGYIVITAEEGATIYYTTNGDDPSTTESETNKIYTGTFHVTTDQTIKAIAVKPNYDNSSVASAKYPVNGVSGGVVTLNDYEDHNWTYYSGVDASVDGGHYNTTYLGKLYSPNPRNVKITYNAVNDVTGSNTAVKVSTTEPETTFVYYKTLEEGATPGQYPYQVISSPFSVRPSKGSGSSKVFYGFAGWKIVSGGEYINGYNNGQTLPLDAEITFVNLPYPSVNCTSAEIVFQTTWTQAHVHRGGGNVSNAAFNGGNYENNFCVINADYTNALTPTYPVTITSVEPDGSNTYNVTFSNLVTPVAGAANTTKLEYIKWSPSGNINAQGRNFTVGRGVTTTGTVRNFYPQGSNATTNQVVKIESGKYVQLQCYSTNQTAGNLTKQWVILGCDYDRATNNGISNSPKLEFTGYLHIADNKSGIVPNTDAGANTYMSKIWMKSGSFTTDVAIAGGAIANSFYICSHSGGNTGKRYLEIQGGRLHSNIAGGRDSERNGVKNNANYVNTEIRIKGGLIEGSIYGGAQNLTHQGSRQIVLTGGEVNGWIAGGANGTDASGGLTDGATYIYVGGDSRVDSHNSGTSIGASIGGNVYGAGCGHNSESTSGQISFGTNVVIADNAYVERGVYGGGSLGYCKTDQTAYVYVTGGHVEGKSGNYTDRNNVTTNGVIGGVFGGARMRGGGEVKMYMTGGVVESGLFGGSNYTGTIEKNVTMQVNGGQVGTSTKTANVHGGGYGQPTRVTGNVDITIGTKNTSTGETAGSAVIYGDVYGGSALGYVNGTAVSTTKHTNVTLNGGDVYGAVYGGGLGNGSNAANVYAPVTVTINGGSATNVFGCNNTNGRPMSTVKVNMTGGLVRECVYGGGNAAAYTGTPQVSISGGEVDKHVFGGGLGSEATITGDTHVIITGTSHVKQNVYGGGNGGSVSGQTHVDIGGE